MNEEERYGIVARLLVEGDIQGTGYRVLVMRNARRMGVVGIVKNLVDGRVEIFCQCKDRPHMDEFIKKISVQKPRDIFSPNVERIQKLVGWPEIEKVGGLTKEEFEEKLRFFKIDYGDIEESQQEVLTKLDIGSQLVSRMNVNVTTRFDSLDNAYDSFGEKIDSIHSDLKSMVEQFGKLVDYFIKKE